MDILENWLIDHSYDEKYYNMNSPSMLDKMTYWAVKYRRIIGLICLVILLIIGIFCDPLGDCGEEHIQKGGAFAVEGKNGPIFKRIAGVAGESSSNDGGSSSNEPEPKAKQKIEDVTESTSSTNKPPATKTIKGVSGESSTNESVATKTIKGVSGESSSNKPPATKKIEGVSGESSTNNKSQKQKGPPVPPRPATALSAAMQPSTSAAEASSHPQGRPTSTHTSTHSLGGSGTPAPTPATSTPTPTSSAPASGTPASSTAAPKNPGKDAKPGKDVKPGKDATPVKDAKKSSVNSELRSDVKSARKSLYAKGSAITTKFASMSSWIYGWIYQIAFTALLIVTFFPSVMFVVGGVICFVLLKQKINYIKRL